MQARANFPAHNPETFPFITLSLSPALEGKHAHRLIYFPSLGFIIKGVFGGGDQLDLTPPPNSPQFDLQGRDCPFQNLPEVS